MRAASVLCVLYATSVPALGEAVTYVYEVTDGTLTLDVEPNGLIAPDPVDMLLGGTFAVTIYDDNGTVGESDTFVLADADLYNAEELVVDLYFGGTGTITAPVGNLYISDFSVVTAGHIGSDDTGSTDTDVYGGGSIYIDLPWWSSWGSDETWSEETETWNLAFGIVDGVPWTVTVDGAFTYEYSIPDLGAAPGMGQGVAFEAILIPEPTVLGLAALGLGGAGAWLRRQR
jgi:hypothetical protein